MMRQMRGVVAALLTLEVGLVAAYFALHGVVELVGGNALAPRQEWPYFGLALVLTVPGALFAGRAAIREAGEPTKQLLWVAALGAGMSAVTWAIFRFDYGVGAPEVLRDPDTAEAVIGALRHAPPGHHGVMLPVFINVHEPPTWFLLALPVAIFAVVGWAGRKAIEKRMVEEGLADG